VTRLPLQHKICKIRPDLLCEACTDLCVVQKQRAICAKCTFDEKPSIFIRNKPIFSSERIVRTVTARVLLGGEISGRGSQGA
jgi:hypothetical protein